jgi:hypothetical protein
MALHPSETTPETIPGDPSHVTFVSAENELALLASRGAGQPHLVALKLRGEARTLHLRTYLKNPSDDFAWASLSFLPLQVRSLANKTSQTSALAWQAFQSDGVAESSKVIGAIAKLEIAEKMTPAIESLDADTARELIAYLRHPGHGLFFDPSKNHDAWSEAAGLSPQLASIADTLLLELQARFPAPLQEDAFAESLEADSGEVEAFRQQIEEENYAVADAIATIKTRGSAQRAFAAAVKSNYGYRCAVTGLTTTDFLVASHVVPWSVDQNIRLDPSNGICLSLLVDRAFEKGYLQIADDLTVSVDWKRAGGDKVLAAQLKPFDGQKLLLPAKGQPKLEYIRRRRKLVASKDLLDVTK